MKRKNREPGSLRDDVFEAIYATAALCDELGIKALPASIVRIAEDFDLDAFAIVEVFRLDAFRSKAEKPAPTRKRRKLKKG